MAASYALDMNSVMVLELQFGETPISCLVADVL